MKKILNFKVLIILVIVIFACAIYIFSKFSPKIMKENGYSYPLPGYLHEISGITYIGNNKIAGIQDEDGVIYIYDLDKKTVTDSIEFGNPGDYEGVAFANGNFYVLRSDAILFDITKDRTIEYNLAIGANNNEGLCYDPQNNRLLIATKSKAEDGKEYKDKRYIYAFDLENKKLSAEPIFIIDITEIENFANSINAELEAKSGKKIIKFRPSGIAIHHQNNNIYIVSAVDNIIVVLNQMGKIIDVKQLDVSIFNQPEGITFLESGEALIANEGEQGIPTLIKLSL
ncbi:MAG: hypothetical protein WC675_01040 [Patescibacteria group bacterium]|jgi:uncharacterized protein YjiK